MPDDVLPFPSPRTPRGVFRAVAPAGEIALVAIDSNGFQFMRWQMPSSVYSAAFDQLLETMLDVSDPKASLERSDPIYWIRLLTGAD